MNRILKPDLCIVGGGAGGLEAAFAAVAAGASVVLVEKAGVGGFVAPQASLLAVRATAARAHAMRHAADLGLADADPQVNFGKLHRHVRDVIDAATPGRTAERLAALGVFVVDAEARFVDAKTLAAGQHHIRPRHVLLATGAARVLPQIDGLDTVDALTTDALFDLTRRPGRLAILGNGGGEAAAIAQAYGRLGVETVLIEDGDALAHADPEAAAIVLRRLRMEGVDMRVRSAARRIERRGKSGMRLHLEREDGVGEAIDATHLLVMGTDAPDIAGLDLAAAGIGFTASGITVDAALRTRNRRVHAIGGAAGAQGEHVAALQARHVVRALFAGERGPFNAQAVPRAVDTDPQIAWAGLDEARVRAAHRRFKVLRWPYAESDRAMAERRTAGFVKLIAGHDERILGVAIVGAEAGEAIGPWALALGVGLRVGDMARHMPGSPGFGEIGKRAAMSYFSEATRKTGARRLIRLPRIFG